MVIFLKNVFHSKFIIGHLSSLKIRISMAFGLLFLSSVISYA